MLCYVCVCQYKRLHHAVESSGGSALLRDSPGSETADDCSMQFVSSGVCVMMMDIKEQNTLPAASQHWVLHVMETLRRLVMACVSSLPQLHVGHTGRLTRPNTMAQNRTESFC